MFNTTKNGGPQGPDDDSLDPYERDFRAAAQGLIDNSPPTSVRGIFFKYLPPRCPERSIIRPFDVGYIPSDRYVHLVNLSKVATIVYNRLTKYGVFLGDGWYSELTIEEARTIEAYLAGRQDWPEWKP